VGRYGALCWDWKPWFCKTFVASDLEMWRDLNAIENHYLFMLQHLFCFLFLDLDFCWYCCKDANIVLFLLFHLSTSSLFKKTLFCILLVSSSLFFVVVFFSFFSSSIFLSFFSLSFYVFLPLCIFLSFVLFSVSHWTYEEVFDFLCLVVLADD